MKKLIPILLSISVIISATFIYVYANNSNKAEPTVTDTEEELIEPSTTEPIQNDNINVNEYTVKSWSSPDLTEEAYNKNILPYLTTYSINDFSSFYRISFDPDKICNALSDYFSESFTCKMADTFKVYEKESLRNDSCTIVFMSDSYNIPVTFKIKTTRLGHYFHITPDYDIATCDKSYISGLECYILYNSEYYTLEYIVNGTTVSINGGNNKGNTYLTLDELSDTAILLNNLMTILLY